MDIEGAKMADGKEINYCQEYRDKAYLLAQQGKHQRYICTFLASFFERAHFSYY